MWDTIVKIFRKLSSLLRNQAVITDGLSKEVNKFSFTVYPQIHIYKIEKPLPTISRAT